MHPPRPGQMALRPDPCRPHEGRAVVLLRERGTRGGSAAAEVVVVRMVVRPFTRWRAARGRYPPTYTYSQTQRMEVGRRRVPCGLRRRDRLDARGIAVTETVDPSADPMGDPDTNANRSFGRAQVVSGIAPMRYWEGWKLRFATQTSPTPPATIARRPLRCCTLTIIERGRGRRTSKLAAIASLRTMTGRADEAVEDNRSATAI